ncbi:MULTISPECIES: hypothetical protein [Rhodococcus]|uniref:hypothetical protein n=1 Tax=Rhodococcus TaxID=1827 RepID=UPI00117A25E9|nr:MULTISPECIES: hypothetical protein [Rhodococcus]MCC4305760.1 hypothetical protein [Rhodococcus sp. 3-2]
MRARPGAFSRHAVLGVPLQVPTDAERDRSSVGGALELSGTGAGLGGPPTSGVNIQSADHACRDR